MDPIALTLFACSVAFLVGAWRGWTACNRRWINAANKGEPVRIDGKLFFAFADDSRWEPTQPPDSLSSE